MFCEACGAPNSDTGRFCSACGKALVAGGPHSKESRAEWVGISGTPQPSPREPSSMWESDRRSNVKKYIAIGLAIIMVIAIYWLAVVPSPNHTPASVSATQNIPSSPHVVSSDELRQDFSATSAQIDSLKAKYPTVMISGKISDRDQGAIQVWGTAVPVDAQPNALGVLYEDSNLLVLNPNEPLIQAGYYTGGIHYFLGKRYGKNAFGQPVPLWVYGDEPQELKDAGAHMESVMKQLDTKSAESAPTRWKAIGQLFASAPHAGGDAQGSNEIESLNQSLHSLASFRNMTLGSPLASTDGAQTASSGELSLYVFPSNGVVVSTYQGKVASLTYLVEPDLLALYYSWLGRFGPLAAFCGSIPPYSPVAFEIGDLAKLGYGGGRDGRDFLNEFGITDFWVDRQRPGLESSIVYITDGTHSRIIGVELYDLTQVRFPLKDLPLGLDHMDGNPSPEELSARGRQSCSPETSQ